MKPGKNVFAKALNGLRIVSIAPPPPPLHLPSPGNLVIYVVCVYILSNDVLFLEQTYLLKLHSPVWSQHDNFTSTMCTVDPVFRSSHRKCYVKKNIFKTFANFTGKYLRWSLLLIKLRLQHRGFSLIFATFLKTPILKSIEQLLL